MPTKYLYLLHMNTDEKKAERTSLVPVKIQNNKVVPVEYHGSAHLFALNQAEGIIRIEPNITQIDAETYVTVRLF